MLRPHDIPGVNTGFYFGAPQETFYSRTESYRPRYHDVKHLIDAGRLIHIFADWEATDKDRATAQPDQFGAVAFDLNMRLIGRIDALMAVGDLHPMAIQAALVARTWPDEAKQGWPGYIGMGMYRDFLHAASHLDGARMALPERHFADGSDGYAYFLDFPDLPERLELEIKASGDQFRFPGEKLKRKTGESWGRRLYSETHFFNGDGYDVNLAAHTAARYNMASLFHATRRAHSAIHVDPLAMARWVWAFGPQGNDGLRLSQRFHVKTRRNVLSFRQEDILKANSPAAYRAIGRSGGVRMFDGTEYDPKRAHGAYADAYGTAALYVLLRQIDPDGVRFVETMASERSQKDFLQGGKDFADRPLTGFVHYDEGMISRGIGFLIETGDTYGQERKNEVLLFNASAYDPEDVSRWTDSELRAKLVQKHNPVAVVYRTNRTTQFAPFERAYKAGAGNNLSPDELDRRRLWLMNHRHTMYRIMSVWGDIRNPARAPSLITTRQPEEEAFDHYGDLKRIEKLVQEPDDIYSRFQKKWDATRRFDTILRGLMETHAVEYSDDPAAVTAYCDRWAALQKKLKKVQENWANPIVLDEAEPTTRTEAIKHLWRLRASLHDHLFNYLPERFVQDENGINLSVEQAMQVPYAIRRKRWQPEDRATGAYWKCVFERNENLSTFRMLDMAFDEADAFYRNHPLPEIRDWWPEFFEREFGAARPWYEARVAMKVQGPPNLEPSKHPSMTVARAVYESALLRSTAPAGKHSDYARFVSSSPQGEQILAAWETTYQRLLAAHPLTPERKDVMGYDPATNAPILNHFFDVPRDGHVRLVVPDRMLDTLHWHDQWQQHLVVARPDKPLAQRLEKLAVTHEPLILESMETGRERLAAKAFVSSLPATAAGMDAALTAQGAYASAGAALGARPFVLRCEQLAPIHHKLYVDENVQTVALPATDWNALVDPRAGSMPDAEVPLTHILVRDTGQRFVAGPVRLCRQAGGEISGDEFGGNLESARLITVDDLLAFDDAAAMQCGKPQAADLVSQWRRTFADLNIRDPDAQKIWSLKLAAPVEKASFVHFKPDAFPVAVYQGEPQRPERTPSPPAARKEAA